ncbi:hypothetical protein K2Z83_08205 [Oscillochloris sp. ZM17-4]|uniref:hypothetical protein n=1 Tax=Oscillochloris sp. ZM17-4 TaxID=2866714 RepID=UPI001C731BC2|nr:hypothetical protein [Oscillochloris sp. ZM17-4]MBX0327658.1 hypothetical protein [Oscillochloris sp. ZM17-4]
MSEPSVRQDPQQWDNLLPEQVIDTLIYEIYNPVSLLGSQLKRLTDDDDPISEDDYEAIFEQMHQAVRQLSRTVVHLKRYREGQKQR